MIANGRKQFDALPVRTLAVAEARTLVDPMPKRREKYAGRSCWTTTRRQSPGPDGEPAGHGPVGISSEAGPTGAPQMLCCSAMVCAAARAASVSAGLT